MKAARALLALIWLAFALTATAYAAPAAACPMADMKHQASAPAGPGAMPCCSQPAVVAAPAPAVPVVGRVQPVRRFPLAAPILADRAIATDPHPPKPLLKA